MSQVMQPGKKKGTMDQLMEVGQLMNTGNSLMGGGDEKRPEPVGKKKEAAAPKTTAMGRRKARYDGGTA